MACLVLVLSGSAQAVGKKLTDAQIERCITKLTKVESALGSMVADCRLETQPVDCYKTVPSRWREAQDKAKSGSNVLGETMKAAKEALLKCMKS